MITELQSLFVTVSSYNFSYYKLGPYKKTQAQLLTSGAKSDTMLLWIQNQLMSEAADSACSCAEG